MNDIITLGHGSGGLLTAKLLDQVIKKVLAPVLHPNNHDGAILELPSPLAISTDSFVVSPLFFPGGDIGDLAINGTVNDVAMCGAEPKFISLALIIEEGLPFAELEQVLHSIKKACLSAKVTIVTGDTKVVDRGKGDKLFINTTGFGSILPDAKIDVKRIEETDSIIISNSIAQHGVAILSVRENLSFQTVIVSDTQSVAEMANALITSFGEDIHFFRDPTRGGVATVLNEVAEQSNVGIELIESQLPIAEQVASACEILGLDPLFSANEGNFIIICKSKIAQQVVEKLQQFPAGKNASIIGQVTTEAKKKVLLKSTIGGRRVVSKLVGDQLPRIC